MHVTETDAGCGAVVSGINLAALSNQEWDGLSQAFADYGVLFFRDQSLTPEQHIEFAERWGPIDINRFFPAADGYPQIAEVRKEPDQTTNVGGAWHTDHSYDQEPAMGSVLVARDLPETGGDTSFANMYAAYDALSDGFKETLSGLRAVHSNAHVFGAEGVYKDADVKGFAGAEQVGNAVHPVVITHPLSGKKALYVNPGFTIRIEGWSDEESFAMLGFLFQHAAKPEFTCRFQWQPGSVAMWDNRSSWHNAANDYQGQFRLMHRITIKGCGLNP